MDSRSEGPSQNWLSNRLPYLNFWLRIFCGIFRSPRTAEINRTNKININYLASDLYRELTSDNWRKQHHHLDKGSQTDFLENAATTMEFERLEKLEVPAKDRVFLVQEQERHATKDAIVFVEAHLSEILSELWQRTSIRKKEKRERATKNLLEMFQAKEFSQDEQFGDIADLCKRISACGADRRDFHTLEKMAREAFVGRIVSFFHRQRTELAADEFFQLMAINMCQLLKTFELDVNTVNPVRLYVQTSSQTEIRERSLESETLSRDFRISRWIGSDHHSLLVDTEDNIDEFSLMNADVYTNLQRRLHQRKTFRHSYTQDGFPKGYRGSESLSSNSFQFSSFGQEKTCFFPLKSVGTKMDKKERCGTSKIPTELEKEVPVKELLLVATSFLQYWQKIEQNPTENTGKFDSSGWTGEFLKLLEYHIHWAKNPTSGSLFCLDHPSETGRDCQKCRIAGLAPAPWQDNLSQSIHRMIRNKRDSDDLDFKILVAQGVPSENSDKAVLLQAMRKAHLPWATAPEGSSALADCDCVLNWEEDSDGEPAEETWREFERMGSVGGTGMKSRQYKELVGKLLFNEGTFHLHICSNCRQKQNVTTDSNSTKFHRCRICAEHNLSVCGYYCSKKCAVLHWTEHKNFHDAVIGVPHYNCFRNW